MGGSIGGLTAGLLLRDAGCDVEIFERVNADLSSRGAGIVVHPATTRYIVENEQPLEGISTSADWWRYLRPDGSVLFEERCRYRFTAWNTIYRALRSLFDDDRYHLGAEVVDLEQDAGGVHLSLADGRAVEADLLVAADGVASTARSRLAPAAIHRYAGYIGWRGTVREAELSDATRAALGDAITYVVTDDRSHILVYPIPNAAGSLDEGERLHNFIWYRNLAAVDLAALIAECGLAPDSISVPPPLVAQRFVDELRSEAAALLPAPVAEVVQRSPEPFIQVIVDVEVERMAFGTACLIGDAAFVLRPHAAVGAAKACVEARTLAEAVEAEGLDLPRALTRWEPQALEVGRALARRTQAIGARYQVTGAWDPADPGLRFGFGRKEFDDPDHRRVVVAAKEVGR
jgi:2,6-dihydroxypyridine 3-monooxygenase